MLPWHQQVDFNAAKEYEMIVNYKVLQAAFTKNGISKVRAVSRCRARLRHSCTLAVVDYGQTGTTPQHFRLDFTILWVTRLA